MEKNGEMEKLVGDKYENTGKSKKLAIGLAFLESREEKKNFIWGYLSRWLDGFPTQSITEGSATSYWCEKTKVGANFATKVNVNGYKGTISKVDELVEHFEKTSDGKNAKLHKDETEAIQRGVRELPIEGKDYWRFGPYKITGIPASEKIRKLVVTEKNSKEEIHDYKIVFYEDQKPKVGKYENIRNNKRFYLCIPKSRSGEFNFEFTTNTESSEQEVRAELYFLESTACNWQNLVIAEAEGRKGKGKTISTSISVKTPGSGTFKIIKKDKYNNARLSGAKFLIFYFEVNENGAHLHNGTTNKFWTFDYVSKDDNRRIPGTLEYDTCHGVDAQGNLKGVWVTRKYIGRSGSDYVAEEISKEKAIEKGYIFETDASGEICLDGLEFPEGRYYCAIEYQAPAGYKWDPAFDTYGSGGDNYFVLNPNKNNPGVYVTEVPNITTKWCNLNLEKVNLMDHNIKLENVGFRFYNDEYGWLSGHENEGNGYSYSWDETKAEEYKTNDVGRIELNNIVSEGNWYCYENPNTLPYGYEMLGDGAYEIGKIENNSTKLYIVENEQKRVKLSGFVWLDQENSKGGDGNTRNNLFRYGDSDNTDLLFDGIEVRLKNKITGETVKTAITGKSESELYKKGHGEYQFTDVEIKELEDLCIEFEYDGLTYQNVICPDMNKINQYINSEGESNPNYDVTTANIASKATEGKREQFNKTFSVIEGKGSDNSTRGIRKGEKGTIFEDLEYEKKENHTMALKNGEYALHENEGYIATSNKGKYPIQADTTTSGYNIRSNFTWGQKEITNINLGLYKREQPDTRLRKDLHNVRLTINGQEHTYEYAQRYNSDGEYKEERKDLNIGVQFKNSYKENSYERPIYKADYKYINKQEESNELKVYVTYQLKIENESTNLKTTIRSIADYYDKEYKLISVGLDLTPEGNTTDDIEREEQPYNETYNKVLIKNIEIGAEAGKAKDIYVQFQLNRKQVEDMLNGQKEKTLYNIAEINSYSISDEKGVYAGIDIDSNPGNCEPGKIDTYEDDTDSAPDLKITSTNDREMTGIVFKDDPLVEEGQNLEGVMTGYKREGNGIYEEEEEGIKDVKVKLVDKKSGMTYYSKTAGEDGIYKITKDDEQTKKNEKEEEREYTFKLERIEQEKEGNNNVYRLKQGEFYIIDFIPGDYVLTYIWGDKEYPVQNYKSTVYKEKNRQNSNKWWYVEQKYNDKGEKQNSNETRYSDAMDDWNTRQKIDEKVKKVTKDTKESIENAYTQGNIPTMESSTPNMEIGIEYKSAYTASKGIKYTYCIENIDFGIIERAKQHLVLDKYINKMKVTLANGQVIADLTRNEKGELKGESKGVTHMKPQPNIQPANGFAKLELDNELMQGTKLEIEYKIEAINKSELDYVEENFYKYGEIAEDNKDNTVVKITPTGIIDYLDKDWSVNTEQYNNIWNIKTIDKDDENDISKDLKETVYTDSESTIKDKTILYTKQLTDELKPMESQEVVLNASKMLTTTTDEISLDNETEEIEVNKTGGRDIETTPGNYIPGSVSQEEDSSIAETVIVTPATGDDLNYIIPIAIGVTALIILGVGVIIIKKKAI